MQLGDRGWQQIFLLSFILQMAGTVVRKIWPDLLSKNQVFALAASLVILKLLYSVPKAAKRYTQSRRDGASLFEGLWALIPVEILGIFRLERATQKAVGAWLRRKPPCVDNISGQAFGYYKNSQYSTIFIIVMVSCVTEVPFSYLLIEIIEKDPAKAAYLHWFLLGSVIYSVILLLGDRHLIRYTQHIVGQSALYLRVGARFKADIPWHAVKEVSKFKSSKELKESRNTWLLRNGFKPSETITCTPIDGPNIVLSLDPLIPINVEKFKIARYNVHHILLFVDDPTAFIQAVQKQTARQCISPNFVSII